MTIEQLKDRVGALYKRRPATVWSTKEIKKLKEIFKRPDVIAELAEIETLYNSGYEYTRGAVETFLNNWSVELDRSRNPRFCKAAKPVDPNMKNGF